MLLPLACLLLASAEPVPGFDRFTCTDRLGRSITYYLSPAVDAKPRPVALMILGSGGQSIWSARDGRVAGGIQNLFLGEARGRYRVLVVEKPGVPFGFSVPQPGTAVGATPEFLAEHTHSRWSEANAAALRAAWRQPGVLAKGALVVGHSEGAMVAATVGRLERGVSHVAMLAGGGANQLFDLALGAERQQPGASAGVYAEWERIRKNPTGIREFAWGHPYRYWSSKLATSPLEEALRSKAALFVASGSADRAVPIESFEVMRAGFARVGRAATFERLERADHGFALPTDPPGSADGFIRVFRRVVEWSQR